jgi:tetrapyrrole methylase family protein/MazG family protein
MISGIDSSDLTDLHSLIEIINKLRSSTGCAWNRAQTAFSLKKYLLEEAAETVEAIADNDPLHLQEELGDLLYQIVLQCEIASEKGDFSLKDVIHQLCQKLILRNPHVFEKPQDLSLEEVALQWKTIKESYHQDKRFQDVGKGKLPLSRSLCLQNEAAKSGFDWPDASWIYDKIREEMLEVQEAAQKKDADLLEEEMGDLLFAVVSLSRALQIDPDSALIRANQKFALRFEHVLKQLQDCPPAQNIEEWIQLWKTAKRCVTSPANRGA